MYSVDTLKKVLNDVTLNCKTMLRVGIIHVPRFGSILTYKVNKHGAKNYIKDYSTESN